MSLSFSDSFVNYIQISVITIYSCFNACRSLNIALVRTVADFSNVMIPLGISVSLCVVLSLYKALLLLFCGLAVN